MSSQPNATAPSLKRCSPATYEAAREFRRSGNVELLPVLMHGIIERYVERERRGKLVNAPDSLRLVEDLGLDSLTLMEIVVLAEEILPISIDNEDMCHLRTLGDVKQRVTELMISLKADAQIPPAPAQAFATPRVPLTSR
jgi:acyl carrier protein